jgi:hypothetical protein
MAEGVGPRNSPDFGLQQGLKSFYTAWKVVLSMENPGLKCETWATHLFQCSYNADGCLGFDGPAYYFEEQPVL